MDAFEDLGARPIINAAGKMTALGGTAQDDAVAAAQASAARWHVDMADLRARAGARIAEITGAEAASITTGAAAGIAISVASAITGLDSVAIHRLPLSDGLPNQILLQGGHQVNFGAPVDQMIRLGGGDPVILGSKKSVDVAALAAALHNSKSIAAFLYVQSHHSVQENMISLPDVIDHCHGAGVPVIVDAAAEEDLGLYISLGADLVTYSGGKAIGGPTSGFIVGEKLMIESCEAQTHGIARSMKVGKEQIGGLMTALEAYVARDQSAARAKCDRVNRIILAGVVGHAVLESFIKPDEAGRNISRVAIRPAGGPEQARELVNFLVAGSPSIRTRNHQVEDGIVLFDPREISEDQAAAIATRLSRFSMKEMKSS